MTNLVDLFAAKEHGVAAATAGLGVGVCPYGPAAAVELERHVWLRWYSHTRLVLAGFPEGDVLPD